MSSSAQTVEGTTEASAPVTVRLRGIGKRFPGVIANDDINIDVATRHHPRDRRVRTAQASPR